MRHRDSESEVATSRDDFRRAISRVKQARDRLILEILWHTGIRASELIALRLQDFDFSSRKLKLPDRVISIPQELVSTVKGYTQKHRISDFLFPTRQSNTISLRRLEQILRQHSLSARQLRQSYLEDAILSGKSSQEIKSYLGLKFLPEKKIISASEYKRLHSVIENKTHELILELLWRTGITVNELVNLRKSDFSFTQNILIIRPELTKSKLPRAITIPEELTTKIREFSSGLSSRSFLFSSQKSSQISPLRVRQILAYYSSKAKLEIIATPQALRNSHIAHAHTRGESLASISERLGIRQLNTNTYGSLLYGGKHEKS